MGYGDACEYIWWPCTTSLTPTSIQLFIFVCHRTPCGLCMSCLNTYRIGRYRGSRSYQPLTKLTIVSHLNLWCLPWLTPIMILPWRQSLHDCLPWRDNLWIAVFDFKAIPTFDEYFWILILCTLFNLACSSCLGWMLPLWYITSIKYEAFDVGHTWSCFPTKSSSQHSFFRPPAFQLQYSYDFQRSPTIFIWTLRVAAEFHINSVSNFNFYVSYMIFELSYLCSNNVTLHPLREQPITMLYNSYKESQIHVDNYTLPWVFIREELAIL